MRQPAAIAILILLTAFPLPVLAQNRRLVSSGCRQGFCWETYVIGKKVIRQDQSNGKPQTVYLVDSESKTSRGTDQRQDWVQCSTMQPFVAFTSPVIDPDKVYVNFINPGDDQLPNAVIGSHLMYWAICHDEWEPNLSSMAGKAKLLGYSLQLRTDYQQVAKAEFIASIPVASPVLPNSSAQSELSSSQSNQGNSTGVSDTPLSGEVDGKEVTVSETKGEVTVEVRYNDSPSRCKQAGQKITVKHSASGFVEGGVSYRLPGCFKGIRIVNLDSDIKVFGKEYNEVILDYQHFDGSTGVIIYDGCGDCNSVGAIQVRNFEKKFRSGYYLEDADNDGALEIITDDLPVEIGQFSTVQIEGRKYQAQVTDVTRDKFPVWYARETARRLREDYPGWRDKLLGCPCTADVAARKTAAFVESNAAERLIEGDYHPGAVRFFRSASPETYTSPTGKELQPGQQCVYDATGKLITDGAGAGTPDAFAPVGTPSFSNLHMNTDVHPFDILKEHFFVTYEKLDEGWKEYQQTWKPDKGRDDKGNVCPTNKVP